MTDAATRERVTGYVRFRHGGPLAWWNDIASVRLGMMMMPTQYKPDHARTSGLLQARWEEEMADDMVHASHCCSRHGCKYAEVDCPVANNRIPQDHPCEYCDDDEREKHTAPAAALQPPPKGWEVSDAAEAGYRAAVDAVPGRPNIWLTNDSAISSRKVGIRGATPHLLRDLADGVSHEVIARALLKCSELRAGDEVHSLRQILRALADTLEGHDGHPNRSAS